MPCLTRSTPSKSYDTPDTTAQVRPSTTDGPAVVTGTADVLNSDSRATSYTLVSPPVSCARPPDTASKAVGCNSPLPAIRLVLFAADNVTSFDASVLSDTPYLCFHAAATTE